MEWLVVAFLSLAGVGIDYMVFSAVQLGGLQGRSHWVARATDPGLFWFDVCFLVFLSLVPFTLAAIGIRAVLRKGD